MGIRIVGIQLRVADATNRKQCTENIQRIAAEVGSCEDADLVVLPELALVGYGQRVFESLGEVAVAADDTCLTPLREAAREAGTYLVFGFAERARGKFYNSAAVIDSAGRFVGVYRKCNLPRFAATMEANYFQAGNRLITFSVNDFRIGVSICFDIRFPEITRQLALSHGIDLMVNPTGFFHDETFASWHPFVVTRAIENQIYVLSVNRAGRRFGNSVFCTPQMNWSETMQKLGTQPGRIEASLSRAVLDRVRNKYNYREGEHAYEHIRGD